MVSLGENVTHIIMDTFERFFLQRPFKIFSLIIITYLVYLQFYIFTQQNNILSITKEIGIKVIIRLTVFPILTNE